MKQREALSRIWTAKSLMEVPLHEDDADLLCGGDFTSRKPRTRLLFYDGRFTPPLGLAYFLYRKQRPLFGRSVLKRTSLFSCPRKGSLLFQA